MPLLDAYQARYKIKFYYWTGVQLVIRVVFYGISSLHRNINLTIGIMLLTVIITFQGWSQPFKKKYKNFSEIIFTINLHCLFVLLLYDQNTMIAINTMVSIAAVHFTIIVMYHIITYTCCGVIRRKIETMINCQQEDISHNFDELQEPFMGFD